MAGAGYFADAHERAHSAPVRILRVLLWADAALTAVMLVAGVLAVGVSVQLVSQLVVMAWPGAVAGVVAWRISRTRSGPSLGRGWFRCLLAAAAWQIFVAVSELLGGDPRGLTSMLLPLAILVLSACRPVRTYLRGSSPGPYVVGGGGGDRGASLVEYAGLILLAALILGSLVALGLPSQVGTGTSAALCRIFTSGDCGGTARRDPSNTTRNGGDPKAGNPNGGTNPKGNPNGGNPDGKRPNDGILGQLRRGAKPCKGFFDCAWKGIQTDPYDATRHVRCDNVLGCVIRGAGIAASSQYNIDRAIVEDGKGIVDLATDPSSVIDAGKYIWQHPGDAARQLVWDDGSEKEWNNGNYVGAVSRGIWNVGSWLIPGGDIAKGISKFGKLGKLAKLTDKTGQLGRLAHSATAASKAADRARRLAGKGDLKGAEKAANDAAKKAEEVASQARKKGCKLVALGESGGAGAVAVSFDHFGRFAAPMLPARDGTCSTANRVKKAAEAAQQRAKEAWSRGARMTPKQLQKKYKHVDDNHGNLGKLWNLPRNYSGANAAKFEKAIRGFMKNPDTKMKEGEYLAGNGQRVLVFYNVSTRAMVMLKPSGEFISAWQLTNAQMRRWLTRDEIK